MSPTIDPMAPSRTPLILRALRATMRDQQGRAIAGVLGVQLIVGMVFYHLVEHWRWLDSLYFSVATLTTVGYGDFSPTTDLSKVFTMGFLITGMGIVAAFVAALGENALREYDREERSEL